MTAAVDTALVVSTTDVVDSTSSQAGDTPAECSSSAATDSNVISTTQCLDSFEIKFNDNVAPVYTPSVDISYSSTSDVSSSWSSPD